MRPIDKKTKGANEEEGTSSKKQGRSRAISEKRLCLYDAIGDFIAENAGAALDYGLILHRCQWQGHYVDKTRNQLKRIWEEDVRKSCSDIYNNVMQGLWPQMKALERKEGLNRYMACSAAGAMAMANKKKAEARIAMLKAKREEIAFHSDLLRHQVALVRAIRDEVPLPPTLQLVAEQQNLFELAARAEGPEPAGAAANGIEETIATVSSPEPFPVRDRSRGETTMASIKPPAKGKKVQHSRGAGNGAAIDAGALGSKRSKGYVNVVDSPGENSSESDGVGSADDDFEDERSFVNAVKDVRSTFNILI